MGICFHLKLGDLGEGWLLDEKVARRDLSRSMCGDGLISRPFSLRLSVSVTYGRHLSDAAAHPQCLGQLCKGSPSSFISRHKLGDQRLRPPTPSPCSSTCLSRSSRRTRTPRISCFGGTADYNTTRRGRPISSLLAPIGSSDCSECGSLLLPCPNQRHIENPQISIFASKFKFFFYQNLDFVLGMRRSMK